MALREDVFIWAYFESWKPLADRGKNCKQKHKWHTISWHYGLAHEPCLEGDHTTDGSVPLLVGFDIKYNVHERHKLAISGCHIEQKDRNVWNQFISLISFYCLYSRSYSFTYSWILLNDYSFICCRRTHARTHTGGYLKNNNVKAVVIYR